MGALEGAVLPKGSLILVTGANGLVGSHVVDQFLKHGYKVKGVVRDAQKNAWLATYFEQKHGGGKFELVEVKDLTDVEALKEQMSGCAGVAGVATATTLGANPDPNVVIPASVNLIKASLEAAAATPTIQRFVLTSSSAAAGGEPGKHFDLRPDSWNTAAVKEAWAPHPNDDTVLFPVYQASKVLQEQEAWKFVRERKPGFVLNTVLPNFVAGAILSEENQGTPSSTGFYKGVWDGDERFAALIIPGYVVDVEDTAMLHVAAMLHPDARGERVFGYGQRKNLNNTLQYLKELYPDRTFPDPPENEQEFLANIVARPRAEELLKWVKGSGWATYEESLRKMCDPWR